MCSLLDARHEGRATEKAVVTDAREDRRRIRERGTIMVDSYTKCTDLLLYYERITGEPPIVLVVEVLEEYEIEKK
jgi:hypothetical protein